MKNFRLSTLSKRLVYQLHRRGSTLLVVVALMGMLSLLGVMFFAFATQEEENAKNFHEAAKVIYDPDLGPDVYFNWALRQLIVGPSNSYERNSALWGSRMSLLPNAYGNDLHPHSGTGITLSQVATFGGGVLTGLSEPGVDLDGDGVHDPFRAGNDANENGIHDFLELNQSPAANVLIPNPGNPLENEARYFSTMMLPEPDVDYTYPDINNVALAYHSWTVAIEDLNGNGTLDADEPDLDGDGALSPPTRVRVVKPSFWRPELLQRLESGTVNEDVNGDGYFDAATEDGNGNGFHDATDFNLDGTADGIARLDPTWYWAPWSTSKVLRPHPEHYYIDRNPEIPPTVKRFLNDYDATDAGIIGALPGGSKGFPFSGRRDTTVAPLVDPQFPMKQGVWTAYGQSLVAHEFDVDADGDNIYEAILMDLSFPVEARPSDGALYVPLFGITVYDADGLLNLNSAGNLSGDTAPPGTNPTPSGPAPTDFFGNGLDLNGPEAAAAGTFLGPEASLSKSSSGISPFEVNPLWALDAVPDTTGSSPAPNGYVDVLSNPDYSAYFNRTPTSYSDLNNRWELANMEFWWLNKGRIDVSGAYPRIISGRLGESNRNMVLYNDSLPGFNYIRYNDPLASPPLINAFPFAGTWNRDDNRNANEGGASTLPNTNGAHTLPFQHPISFSGRGRFTALGNPRSLDLIQPFGGGNPNSWMGYTGYDVAAVPDWITYFGGSLMTATRFGALYESPGLNNNYENNNDPSSDDFFVDDFLEMVLEPLSAQRPADNIFTEADSAILQMSKSDIDNAGVSSRIDDLLPANINPSDASAVANERRRRFGTSSWDRTQYGVSRPTGPGTDTAPGRVGVDDDGNGLRDDARELGYPGSDDVRAYEFNADYDNDGLREFPPQFGAVPPYKDVPEADGTLGLLYPTPQDPFRPELRRLLEVEFGNRDQLRLQRRLSVNGILDAIRNKATAGHPLTSPLETRPLTPHSRETAVANVPVITPGNQLPPFPFEAWNGSTQDEVQEFWARYDRQRLARDIYVMLYTFCGGYDGSDQDDDGTFPDTPMATNASNAVYTTAQLREMAQFSVNIVDAMDRDNVMTIFEYDTNLANGWNLDDQFATVDPVDRAVVAGVEAQQLTLSENLWVFQQELSNDNPYTPFDETMPPTSMGAGAAGFHFMQIELRNISPETVNLAEPNVSTGTGQNSVWRLRWQDTTNPGSIQRISQANNNITNGNGIFFKANVGSVDSINSGALFTIATSNDTNPNSSDLFVDHDSGNPDHELIAPASGTATTSAPNNPTGLTPNTNLDLVNTGQVAQYHLANGSSGDFVSQSYDASAGSAYLVLERRANPKLANLPVTENPWVTVDFSEVERRTFITQDLMAATQAETTTALQNLESRQRRQPLQATNESDFDNSINAIQTNSLMRNNRFNPTVTQFTEVQPHFDRDFTSTIELLNVPIRGPRSLTRAASRMRRNMDTQLSDTNGPHSAFARILRPIHPTTSAENNHWHRLLGFVEVPSRVHRQLGNTVDAIVRIPGRINLNTIRHPEVMAALIDNPELFTPTERDLDGDGAVTAGLEDYNSNGAHDFGLPGRALNDASHDWWFDHLRSRDGVDLTTGLSLPGMPKVTATGTTTQIAGARPFRDLGHSVDLTGVGGIGGNAPNYESPIEDTILRSHPGVHPDKRFRTGTPSTRGLFDVGTQGNVNGNQLHGFVQRQILSKIAGNSTTRSNVFYVFISVQFHEAYRDPATNAVRVGGRIDLNEDGVWDDGHRGFFVIDRSRAEEAYNLRTNKFDWQPVVKHRVTIN